MVTCLYRGVAARNARLADGSAGNQHRFLRGRARRAATGRRPAFRPGIDASVSAQRSGAHRRIQIVRGLSGRRLRIGQANRRLGLEVVLSDVVVETHLPAYDLRGFLAHQLRWARGVRDSRATGYVGLISTYGLMWALLACSAARAAPWSWAVFGVTLLLRVAVAPRWEGRFCGM